MRSVNFKKLLLSLAGLGVVPVVFLVFTVSTVTPPTAVGKDKAKDTRSLKISTQYPLNLQWRERLCYVPM
jgi:hypothetical protein